MCWMLLPGGWKLTLIIVRGNSRGKMAFDLLPDEKTCDGWKEDKEKRGVEVEGLLPQPVCTEAHCPVTATDLYPYDLRPIRE